MPYYHHQDLQVEKSKNLINHSLYTFYSTHKERNKSKEANVLCTSFIELGWWRYCGCLSVCCTRTARGRHEKLYICLAFVSRRQGELCYYSLEGHTVPTASTIKGHGLAQDAGKFSSSVQSAYKTYRHPYSQGCLISLPAQAFEPAMSGRQTRTTPCMWSEEATLPIR